MLKTLLMLLSATFALGVRAASDNEVHLTLIETSDVHGNFFPYDFLAGGKPGSGSLARAATYIDSLRLARGDDSVILLDNGDILQGQPTAYYYNFIDTTATHLCADVLNHMRYDAVTVGNHDIEAGHDVYDRWARQCQMPVLGANAIRCKDGSPYFLPYTIIERHGIRVAVLGMITTGIPQWVPQNLWEGMEFQAIEDIANHYMPRLRHEADVVVGLFHSGMGNPERYTPLGESVAEAIARRVPGFDIIFCGHDHRIANRTVVNSEGGRTLILNPGANAEALAQAEITVRRDAEHGFTTMHVGGKTVDLRQQEPSETFMKHFEEPCNAVRKFVTEKVGRSRATMDTRPSFFGPSAFVDFIHEMQLQISGAEISFAAPLAFDATIARGDITVSDVFNLYRYENMLYVMELSGREIKDYLEFSYDGWTAQMTSPDDHLLRFRSDAANLKEPQQRLQTPNFNFDSAAGIRYTVDVRQPRGSRITILGMADGRPFCPDSTYRCALNSYRGNGGGRHLTEGAGIPAAELDRRTVWRSDRDLRYYMLQYIRRQGTVSPKPLDLWRFIPEDWAEKARKTDERLLDK